MAEEKREEYIIPENYSGFGDVAGLPVRNIVEAVAATLLVLKLVMQIPFVFKIKVIFTFAVCLIVFLFFMLGIKHESVTSFLIGYLQFKSKRTVYHFRRPDEYWKVTKKKKKGKTVEKGHDTYYESAKKKFKEKFG